MISSIHPEAVDLARKVVAALDEIQSGSDAEQAHIQAEAIVLNFLRDIGHGHVAEGFQRTRERVGWWYG